jgi:hypothetical protein
MPKNPRKSLKIPTIPDKISEISKNPYKISKKIPKGFSKSQKSCTLFLD